MTIIMVIMYFLLGIKIVFTDYASDTKQTSDRNTYLLADEGYDVWMGNARGNKYSRRDKIMKPSQSEFWNFSWYEMGIYDLPANIDYVLKMTGLEDIYYVGHSMGSTMFYVLTSMKPEFNSKIRRMVSIAATLLPVILSHFPAGSSYETWVHYGQGMTSGKFRQYDYGKGKNTKLYGTLIPQDYNLTKVAAPVSIIYSKNDIISTVEDVEHLTRALPKVVSTTVVPLAVFSHLDFLWGIDVKTMVYDDVINIIKKF